jgi:hypothetical protein
MGPGMSGILELNGAFLVAGLLLLWGLRGWRSWFELVDGLGLALVLGTCSVGVLATIVLTAGAGLATGTIAGLCAAVGASGLLLGHLRGSPFPRVLGKLPAFTPASAISAVAAAAGAIATAAILVAMFRLARVMPMGGGDSFEFWVPKAKVIYFDGGIGDGFFTSLFNARYPLFIPALQAMDFRFMGSANAPELAVQYWFLYAGFALAAASILRRLAPAWLAWLFVALTGVIPELDGRVLGAQADWPLDLQFALAALLAVAWLRLRELWALVALSIVLAALIATKQEGLLLAGSLYAGLAAATFRGWKRTWPPLLAAGLAAYTLNVPWRIWWSTHHLVEATDTNQAAISNIIHGRLRFEASVSLVVRILFSYPMWLLFLPLALTAAALAVTVCGETRRTAIVFLVTAATAVAGFTYVLLLLNPPSLDEHQSSTPIPRASGSIVLLATVLAPILIAPLLRRPRPSLRSDKPS